MCFAYDDCDASNARSIQMLADRDRQRERERIRSRENFVQDILFRICTESRTNCKMVEVFIHRNCVWALSPSLCVSVWSEHFSLCRNLKFAKSDAWIYATDAFNSFTNTSMRCGNEVRQPQRQCIRNTQYPVTWAGVRVCIVNWVQMCSVLNPILLRPKNRNRNAFPSESQLSMIPNLEKFNSNKHLQSSVCVLSVSAVRRPTMDAEINCIKLYLSANGLFFEMEYFWQTEREQRVHAVQFEVSGHSHAPCPALECVYRHRNRKMRAMEPHYYVNMVAYMRLRANEMERERDLSFVYVHSKRWQQVWGVLLAIDLHAIAHQHIFTKDSGFTNGLHFRSIQISSGRFVSAQVSGIHHVCLFHCVCVRRANVLRARINLDSLCTASFLVYILSFLFFVFNLKFLFSFGHRRCRFTLHA